MTAISDPKMTPMMGTVEALFLLRCGAEKGIYQTKKSPHSDEGGFGGLLGKLAGYHYITPAWDQKYTAGSVGRSNGRV